MRLKWESNFQIEDATMQLAEAFVSVTRFENVDDTSVVEYNITDVTGENVVKTVEKNYSRTFANEASVYRQLVTEFDPAEIVD